MELLDIAQELSHNSYPGRGIMMGRSEDNAYAVLAYFIMGRNQRRNRIFSRTEDGIRTEAFDPCKVEDPSLIIYHPLRVAGDWTILTNGDQTDTIRDKIMAGESYLDALRLREFEPDKPNYTPRISGILQKDGSYALSILKSFQGDPSCCERFFFEYDHPKAGTGHFIHTYQSDGNPLPSFLGEPKPIRISGGLNAFADQIWKHLNEQNKVSLLVRFVSLSTGETQDVIHNKNQ